MPDGAVDVRGNRWPMAASSHGKERIVHDALERVGKVACPPMLPILPSPSEWGYRNKMEFAFGVSGDGGKALGCGNAVRATSSR